MKLLLGALFIFMLSKFDYTKADDDIGQLRSLTPGKYDRNISKRSFKSIPDHIGIHSGGGYSSCESCGVPYKKKEIRTSMINGDDVHLPYKYPWMVQIRKYRQKRRGLSTGYCTGSIISEYFVLTATHCVIKSRTPLQYIEPENVIILFVTNNYKLQKGPDVQQVIAHPNYEQFVKHDIALLKFKDKIMCNRFPRMSPRYGDYIFKEPICLPPADFVVPKDAIVTASGWGLTSKSNRSSRADKLQEAKFMMKRIDNCVRNPKKPMVNESFYCLNGINQQVTCNGDSGGPAFYQHGDRFYIIGVVSFGFGCEVKKPFSFFTSVPYHLSWIKENMKSSTGAAIYGRKRG